MPLFLFFPIKEVLLRRMRRASNKAQGANQVRFQMLQIKLLLLLLLFLLLFLLLLRCKMLQRKSRAEEFFFFFYFKEKYLGQRRRNYKEEDRRRRRREDDLGTLQSKRPGAREFSFFFGIYLCRESSSSSASSSVIERPKFSFLIWRQKGCCLVHDSFEEQGPKRCRFGALYRLCFKTLTMFILTHSLLLESFIFYFLFNF